jgi:hypothetical protein
MFIVFLKDSLCVCFHMCACLRACARAYTVCIVLVVLFNRIHCHISASLRVSTPMAVPCCSYHMVTEHLVHLLLLYCITSAIGLQNVLTGTCCPNIRVLYKTKTAEELVGFYIQAIFYVCLKIQHDSFILVTCLM